MMKKIRAMLKNNRVKDQKGFTLIELLVVVTILGILAAVIVPRVTTSSQGAKDSADAANINILQSAVERYYVEHDNTYPTSLTVLVDQNYVSNIPNSPLTKKAYTLDGTTHKVDNK